MHKKNSKSSNTCNKNRSACPTSPKLSKDPIHKVDSFEFFKKIKANKTIKANDLINSQNYKENNQRNSNTYTSYLSGKRIDSKQKENINKNKELLLNQLKEKLNNSKPFLKYAIDRSLASPADNIDNQSISTFRENVTKSSRSNFGGTSRNCISNSSCGYILNTLPTIDRNTFKSLAVEDQKTYRYVQQLKEYEPGNKINGRYITNDNCLIMKPKIIKRKTKIVKEQNHSQSPSMIQSTTQSHHSSLNLNNFQSFDLLSKHLKASKDQPILSPNKSFVKRQLKGSNSDEEIESNYSEFEDEGEIYKQAVVDLDGTLIPYETKRFIMKSMAKDTLINSQDFKAKVDHDKMNENHTLDAYKPKEEVKERGLETKNIFEGVNAPTEDLLIKFEKLALIQNNPHAMKTIKLFETKDKKRLKAKKYQSVLNNNLIMRQTKLKSKKFKESNLK